jgi:transcriptional antiterminator Rof (Rho-off)
MLSIDTILIPVLGGFLFVKYSYLTRFRAIRDNGYVILFKSSVVGLFFYGFSFLIWRAAILDESANPAIPDSIKFLHEFFGYPEFVPAFFSLFLMGLSVIAVNWALDKDEWKKRVIRQDDDAIEMTILNTYLEENFLLVTLESGKVYVGKVTDTYFRVNDEIRSILLTPFFSGYRHQNDLTLKLTTFYGHIFKQISQNPEKFKVKISDFSVAIRFDHIVSVSPFDPETYAKFKDLGKI